MAYFCTFTASVSLGIYELNTLLNFLNIYTNLNMFLQNIPTAVTETVIGWNSIKRINLFFQSKDVDLKLDRMMIENQNHQ